MVSVGADNAPFIADLKEFVGLRGEGRHVKGQLFGAVSSLPGTLPHLMVAVIVTAYSAPASFFTDGYSRFVLGGDLKVLTTMTDGETAPTEMATQAEAILRYFHRAGVYGELDNSDRLDFLSRVDAGVGRFLLGKQMGALASCTTLELVSETGPPWAMSSRKELDLGS